MSQSDIAISVQGLSKAYTISHNAPRRATFGETVMSRLRRPFSRPEKETFWALKDVDFEIKKGEVVGIIGPNGAGKSTLLKILSRITEPTSGRIELFGRVGSLLEVGTGFHPELTGRENIYLNGAILGMRRTEIQRQFDAIVDFAEVEKFLDTPVKRYSSGMYVRLAFAVAAHLNPEILIVDEVLAVGDSEFQKKCLGKMEEVSRGGRTVLFVSHNMSAVQTLCTSACLLSDGRVAGAGDLSSVLRIYAEQMEGNAVQCNHGALRAISLEQKGNLLELLVDFSVDEPMRTPSLGFVISDVHGRPICGANPKVSDSVSSRPATKEGRVFVKINSPKLLDGLYRLSVWFGDGHEDFVVMKDCLSFEVRGMAGPRQLPSAFVGPVAPECTWHHDIS